MKCYVYDKVMFLIKFTFFGRNRNTRVAERNRKSGRDTLGLSDDTLRKLSALLWYNGNDNCGSSDYGVKTNDARSSSDQQEKVHLKDANADNTNNNKEDLKHCIVEMYEQKDNMAAGNTQENLEILNEETTENTRNEANIEILHQGKYIKQEFSRYNFRNIQHNATKMPHMVNMSVF